MMFLSTCESGVHPNNGLPIEGAQFHIFGHMGCFDTYKKEGPSKPSRTPLDFNNKTSVRNRIGPEKSLTLF